MKNMEKSGIVFSIFLIIVTLLYAIQTGSLNSQNITTPLNNSPQTTTPLTIKTTVATILTTNVITIPVLPTSQLTENPSVNNEGIIEYASPEKIIRPEDLRAGDLIQMSTSDPRFDKDHAFIIQVFSPQNNQFLIKEIVRFKSNNVVKLRSYSNFTDNLQWIGIGTQNPRPITSGALMRDYPYKIGHASQPLHQLCLGCDPDIKQCTDDQMRLRDCEELKS